MTEYIERNSLYKILENWRDAHADVDDADGCGLLEDVLCEVIAQTTADVAPVVHGQWIEAEDYLDEDGFRHTQVRCSLCGRYEDEREPYCHCGARMDLQDQEAEDENPNISRATEVSNHEEKKILDVTCGARTIWFHKNHPAALYCDKRRESYEHLWKNAGHCTLNIDPDVLCDFTDLPFEDNAFSLVVFDPPHLTGAKTTSWLVKKYGKLDDSWPQMLHDGFRECMRVLKPDGVLIFKWSEYDILAEKVWKAIGQKPLFGHHSGKRSQTFWGVFMKGVD